jgi:tetratricopeptide (TPR) repeat protein
MSAKSEEASYKKQHIFAIVILILSIFLVYSNSLNGTWAMDDVIVNKPVGINDIQDIVGFRKITYLTFLINQYIAPFNTMSFRIFNIMIHFINGVLIYILAYITIKIYRENIKEDNFKKKRKDKSHSVDIKKQAFYVAVFSSFVFSLHPININAVAYIIQRMASLATFFVLLSLLCYIFANRTSIRTKSIPLYFLSMIFIIAGIFSKENAIMAIPLIALYDYVFLSKKDKKSTNPPFTKEGHGWIKRGIITVSIVIAIIAVASYFLRLHTTFIDIARFFLNPNHPLIEKGWMAVDVYWTPLQHVLTEFRVVLRYLFLLLMPFPNFLVFDWWGYPVSKGLTAPITTLLSMVALLSLLIFSIWKIKRLPFLCFGILWYLIAISLESFIALGVDLYFEHRNYLPFSGLIIGIAGQMSISFKNRIKEKYLWIFGIVLCLIFGSLTFWRNFVWKDSFTLWGDTLKKSPENIRALMAMGNAHLFASNIKDAERYYIETIKISKDNKRAYFLNESLYSLGMVYLMQGELQKARGLIDILDYTIESYKPMLLRGFYKAKSGDIDGALKDYKEVLGKTEKIDTVVLLTLMGDAYREKGLWDSAIEQYNKALSNDQTFSSAYYGIGASYMAKRNIELAAEYFKKALFYDPNNISALSDLADLMLIKKENPEKALIYAKKAIEKSPLFYQPYMTMGNVLLILRREKEADEFYNEALKRGMPDYMIPFSKARVYWLKGDMEKVKHYLSEIQKYKNLPEELRELK